MHMNRTWNLAGLIRWSLPQESAAGIIPFNLSNEVCLPSRVFSV